MQLIHHQRHLVAQRRVGDQRLAPPKYERDLVGVTALVLHRHDR